MSVAEIQRLKSMGLDKRAIARILKISRNTLIMRSFEV